MTLRQPAHQLKKRWSYGAKSGSAVMMLADEGLLLTNNRARSKPPGVF